MQVPMFALVMASCLAMTGRLARQAISHADSFPQTDADTSARYCRTLQHDALDPPAASQIATPRDSTHDNFNAFGSVLAQIPSALEA
jgi:hypothetical protein